MCTRILKKESSSRALAFVALLFMMPLGFIGNAQSCGAMEDIERQPLLKRDVVIPINGDGGDVGHQLSDPLHSVALDRELPNVRVPEGLLRELDSSNAIDAMKNVKTALRLADAVDAEDDGVVKEIHEAAVLNEVKCDQEQTLGEVIIGRGISGADVVQSYFVQNREKIAALVKTVQEYQGLVDELKATVIKERKENLAESQRIHGKYKCIKTTRTILAICIPVAFIIGGVGAWALTWYLGGKH